MIKSIPNKWNLRVYHHQTSLVRNVKGPYLSGEEKTVTRNKKIYERNRLSGKGTYIIKAVDQSKKKKASLKVKKKNPKFNYNCNKYLWNTKVKKNIKNAVVVV